jgi:simple sugar transport system substrate-binding protein
MAIAYHSDMRSIAPDAQLVSVTHRWGDYYTARAKAVLEGGWKPGAVWGGVKDGMIRVGDFGPKVPKAVRAEVLAAQRAMAQGKLHPFHAVEAVHDNEGHVVIAKGETLSDEKILGMNWLVAGVQGKISH